MIQQVSFKNYKCLRDVTIDLEPFTVFVGANGSGKTSILQGIDLLCRTFQVQSTPTTEELLSNRTYGTNLQAELLCLDIEFWYKFSTHPNPIISKLYANRYGSKNTTSDVKPDLWFGWNPSIGVLPLTLMFRPDVNALRNATLAESDPRLMHPNGQGLHSATASMNLEDPDLWQKLQEDLRRIVPSIKRLRHTPQNQLLFDTINGKGLSASQISEGTLLTLGLLTAIHGPNKPGILLLDDLDRALHPKAQRELIDLLRGVQATNPDIQIIGTTHSPYMLDCMKPEEVRMTSLKEDGSTACDALTHHPKFEKWKDEFDPGEMWSFFGEKWVSEGEVAAR